MAGMCHLTPPEMIGSGIIRPPGFNPLSTRTTQLANVIDHRAFYARMNLVLDHWDQPIGAPGPHMGTDRNLAGPIAFRKPLVTTQKYAPKVALSPRSGYPPRPSNILGHVFATP
jgi:hypothetical protein